MAGSHVNSLSNSEMQITKQVIVQSLIQGIETNRFSLLYFQVFLELNIGEISKQKSFWIDKSVHMEDNVVRAIPDLSINS